MTKEEYNFLVGKYEYEIERNRRIRCERVAKRYERMLEELKKSEPQINNRQTLNVEWNEKQNDGCNKGNCAYI